MRTSCAKDSGAVEKNTGCLIIPEYSNILQFKKDNESILFEFLKETFLEDADWIYKLLNSTKLYKVVERELFLKKHLIKWLTKFDKELILKGFKDVELRISAGLLIEYNLKYIFNSILLNNQIKVVDIKDHVRYSCVCCNDILITKSDYSLSNCPFCGTMIDYEYIENIIEDFVGEASWEELEKQRQPFLANGV
jgi:hypothetical protein